MPRRIAYLSPTKTIKVKVYKPSKKTNTVGVIEDIWPSRTEVSKFEAYVRWADNSTSVELTNVCLHVGAHIKY